MSMESNLKIIRQEKRKTTNHQSGIIAESMAVKHLEKLGFEILAQRYKCKVGEIDIIAKKSGLIAFVEVKSRRGQLLDDPIGKKGKKRIASAALQYIYENPKISELEMRFDFIFVDNSQDPNHTKLEHIESAWIMEE